MYTYQYPRAAITTDAIVFVTEKKSHADKMIFVLLIQRGKEPFRYKWALPGGFIEMDEVLETACKRELEEETGLQIDRMKQFRTYDSVDRDPRHRTISVVYSAEVMKQEKVKGGDDAAKAKWFPISQLPELAFDHKQILMDFFKL